MKTNLSKLSKLLFPVLFLSSLAFSQTKVYEGIINEKYNIEMHLNFVKNSIYGYYFYKSKKLPIALYGEIDGTKFKLIESGIVDTAIFFQGNIIGSQIRGQWVDNNNKIRMSFSVTQLQRMEKSKYFSTYNGNYENISTSQSKFCTIYYIDNNLFYYECSVGTENCDGKTLGIAKLGVNGKAQSLKMSNPNEDCYLKFTFKKNKLKIEEVGDCTTVHGASCTFGGEFIK